MFCLRLLVSANLVGLAACGASSNSDVEPTTTLVPCAGAADDGVIQVPSECSSVGDAADRADEVSPPAAVRVSSGTYHETFLSIYDGVIVEGVDGESRPVINVPDVSVQGGTIRRIDLNLESSNLAFATLDQVHHSGYASLYGSFSFRDVEFGGRVDLYGWDQVTSVTIERSVLPLSYLQMSGDVIIKDSVFGDAELVNAVSVDVMDSEGSLTLSLRDSLSASARLVGFVGSIETTSGTDTSHLQLEISDSWITLLSLDEDGLSDIVVLRSTIFGVNIFSAGELSRLSFLNSHLTNSEVVIDGSPMEGSYAPFYGALELGLDNCVVSGDIEFAEELDCPAGGKSSLEFDVVNTILVDVNLLLRLDDESSVKFQYSDFWNSECVECYRWIPDGTCGHSKVNFSPKDDVGNLEEDPLFVSYGSVEPDTDDLHLQPSSGLIDMGDPGSAHYDLDGSPNDMGIYGGPNAPVEEP